MKDYLRWPQLHVKSSSQVLLVSFEETRAAKREATLGFLLAGYREDLASSCRFAIPCVGMLSDYPRLHPYLPRRPSSFSLRNMPYMI